MVPFRRMRLSKPAALLTVAVTLLFTAPLAAELTVTTTTSIEGGMSGAGGGAMSPKVTTRISGTKSRTDIDLGDQQVSTIIDTAINQMFVLHPEQKTAAQYSTADAAPDAAPAASPIAADVKATGKTRDIDGVSCAEYAVDMKMDMATVVAGGGSALPPEAAAMLKGVFVRITGSTWVAKDGPGAAEYAVFQKAAGKAAMTALSKPPAGANGAGISSIPSGMERLVTGFPEAQGVPYLTELSTAVEGSGQFVALLQGMAQMKITSKVTRLSTEPIAADAFTVPEDYTLVKQ